MPSLGGRLFQSLTASLTNSVLWSLTITLHTRPRLPSHLTQFGGNSVSKKEEASISTKATTMRQAVKDGLRGSLIVFEGCDRSGKTTQCNKLMERLRKEGKNVALWKFPDRTTPIGQMIDAYLQQNKELEDHTVHLLFAVNRWEKMQQMKDLLLSGTTLIVDRYSYSGVAYTSAKGLDLHWCRQPEIGLVKPDQVIYINLNMETAMSRSAFGQERYEKVEFQKKVRAMFKELEEPSYWKIVNGEASVDEVHEEIYGIASKIMSEVGDSPLSSLWTGKQ